MFISILNIEWGTFIIEEQRYSYFTGATFRFMVYQLFFLMMIYICMSIFAGSANINIQSRDFIIDHKIDNGIRSIFLLICLSVLILSYVNIIISGNIPLFSRSLIDRVTYLPETILWPFLSFFGKTIIIVPITLGYIMYLNKNKRNIIISLSIIFLVYLFYIILVGQKFGPIVYGIFYFLLPSLISFLRKNSLLSLCKRIIIPFCIISGLLLILLLYHYSKFKLAKFGMTPFMLFKMRILDLHGHVYWGIDRLIFEKQLNFSFDMSMFLESMHTMMRLVSPRIAEEAITRGTNFTGGFPSSVILFWGPYLAFIVLIVTAAALTYLYKQIMSSIIFNNIFLYVLSIYMYSWLINFTASGEFGFIISIRFISFIIIFIGFKISYNVINNRKIYINQPMNAPKVP